jgi:hypothetical protein
MVNIDIDSNSVINAVAMVIIVAVYLRRSR